MYIADGWGMLLHVPAVVSEDPALESILFFAGQTQPRFDPPEVIGY